MALWLDPDDVLCRGVRSTAYADVRRMDKLTLTRGRSNLLGEGPGIGFDRERRRSRPRLEGAASLAGCGGGGPRPAPGQRRLTYGARRNRRPTQRHSATLVCVPPRNLDRLWACLRPGDLGRLRTARRQPRPGRTGLAARGGWKATCGWSGHSRRWLPRRSASHRAGASIRCHRGRCRAGCASCRTSARSRAVAAGLADRITLHEGVMHDLPYPDGATSTSCGAGMSSNRSMISGLRFSRWPGHDVRRPSSGLHDRRDRLV